MHNLFVCKCGTDINRLSLNCSRISRSNYRQISRAHIKASRFWSSVIWSIHRPKLLACQECISSLIETASSMSQQDKSDMQPIQLQKLSVAAGEVMNSHPVPIERHQSF